MLTNRDKRFFEITRLISYTSEYKRIKIGAIVVKKNKIISVGVNSYKTHPIQRRYNIFRFNIFTTDTAHTLHAEIQALVNIPYGTELSDLTLYTYRENRDGKLAKSRPCPSCMNLIKDIGIKKICYTTDEGYAIEYLK